MDYCKIKSSAQDYLGDMVAFLRDLVRIPGESAQEERVIERIAQEMNSA